MALPGPTFYPAFPFYTGGGAVVGPISEAGGVTDCVPDTITLDGYTFAVELNGQEGQWRSGPVDTFRDTIVGGNQLADDSLFSAKGAWGRYRYSWHHGSGQSIADFDPSVDNFRFLSAYGLAWNTKYQLQLQHATANNRTLASSTPVLCRSDIYAFCGDGATLYRSTDLITWTAMTAPGGTINALTSDGTDLYVATTTGVVKYVGSGTTPTAFATPVIIATDNIAFCSGRLLVGQANLLKEVAATGGYVSTIKTHFQPAFRWTTIFNIGSRIYVGGFAGSRSELHTITTDSGGTLVIAVEAAPLPTGEKLRTGLSFAGAAVLCTSNGMRFASIGSDGSLTYGPLVTEPGDVLCAASDGRWIFAGWSSMAGGRSGVARFVVDDDVNALQPAYAADIAESTLQANVTGVVRLGGLTAFSVAASGIWVESSSTYTTAGTVDSGKIAFGTVEKKGLVALTVTFSPLQPGETVEAYVYDDNGVNIGSGVQAAFGLGTLEVDLSGAQVSSCRVVINVVGTGATTPTIFKWRMRAYPVPPVVLQWLLPLIVHTETKVNIGEGMTMSYDVDNVHLWIEQLCGTRRYTRLRVGTRSYRVRVDNFEWRPRKWTAEGTGPQGLLTVQLIAT